MTEPHDGLVEEYLTRVDRAAADLPLLRRHDLLSDLREHIDAARAELPDESPAQVRLILGRLGEPTAIAAAARADSVPPGAAARPHVPGKVDRAMVALYIVVFVVIALGLVLVVATYIRDGATDHAAAPRSSATIDGPACMCFTRRA